MGHDLSEHTLRSKWNVSLHSMWPCLFAKRLCDYYGVPRIQVSVISPCIICFDPPMEWRRILIAYALFKIVDFIYNLSTAESRSHGEATHLHV